MRRLFWLSLAICLYGLLCGQSAAVEVEPLLTVLKAVGPKGAGNEAATGAWKKLATARAGQLPEILAGLDDAGSLAANWIRAAVETIAERELKSGGKLPADRLEMFVKDTNHAPRARRLAYEWLVRVDATAEDRLIPGMLDDPSPELRRDAVARLIGEAEALADTDQAADVPGIYEAALTAARDADQVRLLAGRLKDMGKEVDLARHFGFVQCWKVIGPFDNTDEKGLARVYPPERKIDYNAKPAGKTGPVAWVEHQGKDEMGKIDINQIIEPLKEVCAYAATEFVSPTERDVQIRFSSFNAVKVWLNGREIAVHDQYHSGAPMDQFAAKVRLRKGSNTIMIKVCQNAQTQDWAKAWEFTLRVCDANGGGVLSSDRE